MATAVAATAEQSVAITDAATKWLCSSAAIYATSGDASQRLMGGGLIKGGVM